LCQDCLGITMLNIKLYHSGDIRDEFLVVS
jgi:hypothetical protein